MDAGLSRVLLHPLHELLTETATAACRNDYERTQERLVP
jgi:hypothetical protein